MSKFDYDLFVIGAGSGGVRASRIASTHGAKVGICEEHRIGGTCVIRGCVPKKLMVYASHMSHEFEIAQSYGWSLENPAFDWNQFITSKDKEIDRLNAIYIRLLENAGVDIHHERGVVLSEHEVQLGNKIITAERILISVGCSPDLPNIPGIEHVKSSNEIFHLKEQPSHILIVGGGYIAVEFAGIFNGLGSKVTQILRGDKMLRSFDQDSVNFLTEQMQNKGIDICFHEPISHIDSLENGQLKLVSTTGKEWICDEILYATGRSPKLSGLGLEEVGVNTAKGNGIIVNDQFQTNIPSIYAVGDVLNEWQLTPVALAQGHWLADHLYGPQRSNPDFNHVATSIFSQPPLSTVGFSEEELNAKSIQYDAYVSSFRPMKYSLSNETEKTFIKLLVSQETDKILGCHITGLDSPEMMQSVSVAINCGATKADFDRTIGIHPTSAEELVTLRQKRN